MSYIFERDFDREIEIELGIAPAPDLADAEETELAARLEAACAAARAEGVELGRAQALAEARAETGAAVAATLDRLGAGIADLAAEADTHRAALEAEMAEFALALCDRIAPHVVKTLAAGRLRSEILGGLKFAMGSARVRVRLPAEMRATLEPEIAAEADRLDLAARIEIVADDRLGAGEGRVEWDNGVMDHNFAQLCDRVLGALRDTARPGADRAETRSRGDD